jgi:16S rRNA (guanine527-N7)-methyltransferase
VTARACAALPVVVELALPLLRPGGQLLAWKGPLTEHDEELRNGAEAAHQLGGSRPSVTLAGPSQLGGHTFVRIVQRRPAPSVYPRRVGEPQRHPLGGGRRA